MAKDTYYFQHDYNARNDEKTAALISDHGAAGYGIYWIIAEMLHEDNGSSIEFSEKKLKRIAAQIKSDYETLKRVLDDCIDIYELFEVRHGYLTSGRVVRNKERVSTIKAKRSAAGKKGAATTNSIKKTANDENIASNADLKSGICRAFAEHSRGIDAAEVDKGKEMKEKEIKGNENIDKVEGGETSSPAPSKEDLLKQKQTRFYNSLVPYLGDYGKEMIRAFYNYWSEPNKSRTKMKWENEDTWELKRRLDRWRDKDDKWQSRQPQPQQTTSVANRKL